MKQFTQAGRITSIHGVILPPKKKQIVKKYITVRFVLQGTIPSKKNMIWADTNLFKLMNKLKTFSIVKECLEWLQSNLRAYIRNSKKYTDWVEEQSPIVLKQARIEGEKYKNHGIVFPLTNTTVKVYHYWADNMARDNSNKYDSIIDLLVACGILKDDAWQNVEENKSASQCYHGEILDHITTIDITQRIH